MTKPVIDYILHFLLYENAEASALVGYTANQEEWKNYKVVILPKHSLYLHLEFPTTQHHDTLIIEADLIYTAYCLLSRKIEEQMQRDEHNRACWKKNRDLFTWIDQPILDVWGHKLLQLLNQPTPRQGIRQINLTHDVDTIAHYRHLRGFLGGIKRGEWSAVWKALHNLQADNAFTFPWLLDMDSTIIQSPESNIQCHKIYFIKATEGKGFDYPQYNLQGKDFQQLAELLKANNAKIGLHTSYYTGNISAQKQRLEEAIGQKVTTNRWHYLRTDMPTDFAQLQASGITDDYTMGFADYAGFRLGTSRAVHWINPTTQEVTNLLLHPLTIMDCTLSNDNYMNLNEEAALHHSQLLINTVHKYAGEVTLLWHNNTFGKGDYHDRLYPQLIQYLQQQ